jgi:hypothetical protein
MFDVTNAAPRSAPETNRRPTVGWRPALAAVLCLLTSLGRLGSDPPPLPDSVQPCVPCHNGGGNEQVAEWLASPYSETRGGRGCTDCHDRYCSGNGDSPAHAVDLATVESHGARTAVRLTVTAICTGDAVKAEVAVSNVGVGHLLPTGSREQSLVLEVVAHDRDQVPLPQRERSTDSAATGESVVFQTRLRPFATLVRLYRFDPPESSPASVSARLVLVPATGPPLEIASSATTCATQEWEAKVNDRSPGSVLTRRGVPRL